MKPDTKRNRSYLRGHVAFFYTSLDERLSILADYFKEGFTLNELCIYAAPGSAEQAEADFLRMGLDVSEAVRSGRMHIYEMNSTYLPEGKFVADYMLSNVAKFIEDAKDQGFSGLRTAGEMRWINGHPEYISDAARYEGAINDLCDDHHDFMGLCLYPLVADADDILRKALHTHPAFVYDGQFRVNPYAITSNYTMTDESVEPIEVLLERA